MISSEIKNTTHSWLSHVRQYCNVQKTPKGRCPHSAFVHTLWRDTEGAGNAPECWSAHRWGREWERLSVEEFSWSCSSTELPLWLRKHTHLWSWQVTTVKTNTRKVAVEGFKFAQIPDSVAWNLCSCTPIMLDENEMTLDDSYQQLDLNSLFSCAWRCMGSSSLVWATELSSDLNVLRH